MGSTSAIPPVLDATGTSRQYIYIVCLFFSIAYQSVKPHPSFPSAFVFACFFNPPLLFLFLGCFLTLNRLWTTQG